MKLTLPFFMVIIILSCGNSSETSDKNNTLDNSQTSKLYPDTLQPKIVTKGVHTQKHPNLSNNDNNFKIIEDVFFGFPSSEESKYYNRKVDLGNCQFNFGYFNFNEASLGGNTITGLYSIRLSSESICEDIGYLIKLLTAKYGQPKIIKYNEPGMHLYDIGSQDIRRIEQWDNDYWGSMVGGLAFSDPSLFFITDENTKHPDNFVTPVTIYKWKNDVISVELNYGFLYKQIVGNKIYNYKGPNTGARYICKLIERYILVNKPFIEFTHTETSDKLKQYLDHEKIKKEEEEFKKDVDKL